MTRLWKYMCDRWYCCGQFWESRIFHTQQAGQKTITKTKQNKNNPRKTKWKYVSMNTQLWAGMFTNTEKFPVVLPTLWEEAEGGYNSSGEPKS